MGGRLIIHIVSFVVLVLLQVLLLRHVSLFNMAFCFIYVSFLITMPLDIDRVFQLLLAFLLGFAIDLFYDSLGMHAAASVLFIYLRGYWIAILPKKTDDFVRSPHLGKLGIQRFAILCLPLIFIHHFALFFTALGNWDFFFFTFSKVLLSTVFSFMGILLINLIFNSRKQRSEF
jgi:hypothetical protein